MNTRETIESYFHALRSGGDWRALLADDLTFANRVARAKETAGKSDYLASTAGFFAMVTDVETLQLLVDGNRAATLSRYTLSTPDGRGFTSDVAEFLTVADGAIAELTICFDTAPYPQPLASEPSHAPSAQAIAYSAEVPR